MRDIAALGCIVCRNEGKGKTPADAHHILSGGRKIDDYHTIPLCVPHHRAGVNNKECVSRHPWRTEFERRYGCEMKLLAQTRELFDKEYGLIPIPTVLLGTIRA
jgi:hypothetical protein